MTTSDGLLLDTPATRPCTHRRVKHVHGTEGRYSQDGCKCLPCRTAHDEYQADHPTGTGHGGWLAFADAAPVRAHVQDLIRAGLAWPTVAERADLSKATVRALLYGRGGNEVTRIRPRTARLLLAVTAGRYRATTPDLLTQGAARDANEEPRPLRATVRDVLPGRRDPRGRGES